MSFLITDCYDTPTSTLFRWSRRLILFGSIVLSFACSKTITEDERLPHQDMGQLENLCADVTCPTLEDSCGGIGACEPSTGECVYLALEDGTRCDDQNVCTIGDVCEQGVCTPGDARLCQPISQCHEVLACDPVEGCKQTFKESGAACDDQNACTEVSTCDGLGQCVGTPTVCPSLTCFGLGICNPSSGECEYTPDNQQTCELESAEPCMTGMCLNGECTAQPLQCERPDNPCQMSACDPGSGECVISNKEANESCSDGDPCTRDDYCDGAGVCVGSVVSCDVPRADQDCRSNGRCNSQTGDCEYDYPEVPPESCDDGDLCHERGVCLSGVCTARDKRCPINAANQCRVIECNPENGQCEALGNQPSTTPCNTNVCRLGQKCDGAGECDDGTSFLSCPPSDDCNEYDRCDPTVGCQYRTVNTNVCDDRNACTTNDRCVPRDENDPSPKENICAGTEVTCPDLDPQQSENFCRLTQGACNQASGSCEYPALVVGEVCNDFNLCTTDTVCNEQGECVGAYNDCADQNALECKYFECQPDSGLCVDFSASETQGDLCEDMLYCTETTLCTMGECAAFIPRNCTLPASLSASAFRGLGRCDEMMQDCFFLSDSTCGDTCPVSFEESRVAQTVDFVANDPQNEIKYQSYYNYNSLLSGLSNARSVVAMLNQASIGEPKILLGGANGYLLLQPSIQANGEVGFTDRSDLFDLTYEGENVQVTQVRGFAVGDINHDQFDDVVMVTSSQVIVLTAFLDRGEVSYRVTGLRNNLQRVSSATLVDVDQDAQPELIVGRLSGSLNLYELVVDRTSNEIAAVQIQDGVVTLQEGGTLISLPVNEVRVLDLNRDGYLDLMTCGDPDQSAGDRPKSLNVLINRGELTSADQADRFSLNPPLINTLTRNSQREYLPCEDLKIVDLNRDHVLDLVVLHKQELSWLRGAELLGQTAMLTFTEEDISFAQGDEDLYAQVDADLITQSVWLALNVADWNADGYLDFYVSRSTDPRDSDRRLAQSLPDSLFLGSANLSFTDLIRARDMSGNTISSEGALHLDLNRDGKVDLFVTHPSGQPTILFNEHELVKSSVYLKVMGRRSHWGATGVEGEIHQLDSSTGSAFIVGSDRSGTSVGSQGVWMSGFDLGSTLMTTLRWSVPGVDHIVTQRRYHQASSQHSVEEIAEPLCELAVIGIESFCGSEGDGCCLTGDACANTSLACDLDSDTCETCIGERGCSCDAQGECNAASLRCNQGDGLCEDCPPGTLDCPCNSGICNSALLRCNPDQLCETCPLGTLGCPCDSGSCETLSLRCGQDDLCVSCVGEPGCSCGAQGLCALGHRCDDRQTADQSDDLCAPCSDEVGCSCDDDTPCNQPLRCNDTQQCESCAGEVSCPCRDESTCDVGAVCDEQTALCVACEGEEGCTCLEDADCVEELACSDGNCAASNQNKNNADIRYSYRVVLTFEVTKLDPADDIRQSVSVLYRQGNQTREVPIQNLRPDPQHINRYQVDIYLSRQETNAGGHLEIQLLCEPRDDPNASSRNELRSIQLLP